MKNSHKKNIIQVSVLFIIFLIVLPSNVVFADISRPMVLNKVSSSNLINQKIENNNIPMRGEEAIYYYKSVNDNALGLGEGGTFEGAIRITPDKLSQYEGWLLTAVRFYHYVNPSTNETHSGNIKIYDNGTSSNPGILLASESFNATGTEWKRIDLSIPLVLNITEDIWVSIEITHNADEYPIATDNGPAVDGKGDWITTGGGWIELQNIENPDPPPPFFDYNWNIEAIISDIGGDLIADAGGPYKKHHVNETVNFQGSAIGGFPPYTYYWDFGDGENSTFKDTTHVYNETGFYNISLKVTDNKTDIAYDNVTIQIVPEGADITPPETNCTLDGEMTEEGVYIKNVKVTLTAFDNETAFDNVSGINFTKYKLNDGTLKTYTEPFILTEEDNHTLYTLYFYSEDNASNREEEKSCTFSIEPSKTELGINISKTEVIIKNIGDENATDVVWSVDIKGGVFGLTDEHIDGNISNLTVGFEEVVDLPSFFGFGRVEIVAAADATNAEEVTEVTNGFMIFFFILGIRNF